MRKKMMNEIWIVLINVTNTELSSSKPTMLKAEFAMVSFWMMHIFQVMVSTCWLNQAQKLGPPKTTNTTPKCLIIKFALTIHNSLKSRPCIKKKKQVQKSHLNWLLFRLYSIMQKMSSKKSYLDSGSPSWSLFRQISDSILQVDAVWLKSIDISTILNSRIYFQLHYLVHGYFFRGSTFYVFWHK